MNLDFSKSGAWDGIKHGLTVAAYVALSGALVAVGQYLAGLHADASQVGFAAFLMLANAVIAGLERWLQTKAPTR